MVKQLITEEVSLKVYELDEFMCKGRICKKNRQKIMII